MVEATLTGTGIAAHSWPSWLSAGCRPAAKVHVPCMRASLRPPPPFARSPAIRPAQHLSAASATVGANSATDVRVSAETAMQHTRVMACHGDFRAPRQADRHPAKTERLADRLEFIEMMRLGGDIAAWCAFLGLRVTLAVKPDPIASALKRAAGLYQNSIEARRHAPSPRRLHENMIAPN
jgi:hypothetical protein